MLHNQSVVFSNMQGGIGPPAFLGQICPPTCNANKLDTVELFNFRIATSIPLAYVHRSYMEVWRSEKPGSRVSID